MTQRQQDGENDSAEDLHQLLCDVGEALYGPQWQRELARGLGVAERTMRYWRSGTRTIPATVVADLLPLVDGQLERLKEIRVRLRGKQKG